MKKNLTNFRYLLPGLLWLLMSMNLFSQAPANLITQAYGVNDLVLRWTLGTDDSYQIEQSLDSVNFTIIGTTNINTFEATGLDENTVYYFRVTAIMGGLPVGETGLKTATIQKELVVHLPLNELIDGNLIKNIVTDSTDAVIGGSVTVVDAESSGRGVPVLKFLGSEVPPVASHIRLWKTVQGYDAHFTGRTMSFWMKNESPAKQSIPLSIGKRAGGTIALKDGKLYGLTAMRHGDVNRWWADKTEVEFNSSDWTLITYVFDNPVTRLYVNGVMVDESDGIGKMDGFAGDTALLWPSFWEINAPTNGDGKSAEIGCLVDNNAALVTYLGDSWDAGLRPMWAFNGMLSDIKMYNYAMTDKEIIDGIAPAPTGLIGQAYGINEIVLRWAAGNADGYQVSISSDSINWEVVETVNVNTASIKGLEEDKSYFFKVASLNQEVVGGAATIKLSTLAKTLVVHLPLNELIDGNLIKNIVTDSTDAVIGGSVTVVDAESSGRGVPVLKFLGSEVPPVASHIRLWKTVQGYDAHFTGRTMSFWMKNESPAKQSIPLSIGKRAGGTIALKDGKLYGLTAMRHGDVNRWWADKTEVEFNSSDWTLITYVFDNPVTRLYVNGVMVDESDGIGKMDGFAGDTALLWPSFWEINAPTSGDGKSAEIGCLVDNNAALVTYLGDSWDAGLRPMWAFNGMLSDIKMYNYAMTDEEISEGIAPAPTGLIGQAYGINEIVLRWTAGDADGYQVSVSSDSINWEVVKTVNVNTASIKGLAEETSYFFKVASLNDEFVGGAATIKLSTLAKTLVVHLPLNELVDGDKIQNVVNNTLDPVSSGTITLVDAATSGLGVPALKFLGLETPPVASHVRLWNTVQGYDAHFTGRTMSFWMKNESPAKQAIPLSLGKRAGGTIALKDGKLYGLTAMRTGDGNKWWVDKTEVEFNSGDWTYVTYVFDNPVTRIYINGVLMDESDGIGKMDGFAGDTALIWPTHWEINAPTNGDGRSAEIGCLVDNSASLVTYLGDAWDPGLRPIWAFNGMLSNVKMYNYAMSDADIKAQYNELAIELKNLKVAASGPQDLTLTWTNVTGNTGYKVMQSDNGTNWTDAATLDADVTVFKAFELIPATEYFFKVIPQGVGEVISNNTISGNTIMPALVSHFEFTELVNGTGIKNSVDATVDEGIAGQVAVAPIPSDVRVSLNEVYAFKAGINAISFTQLEVPPVTSYARLHATVQTAGMSLTQRSITLWVKNNDPARFGVPLSMDKRGGLSFAFRDNKFHAYTKMRPGNTGPWFADSTGADYTSTDWNHIAYVYTEPITKIYINGVLADESDGIFYNDGTKTFTPLPYSSPINSDPFTSGAGNNAEIGALYDPCAALVKYMGGNWDLAARHGFNGSLADLRFYNYGLGEEEIGLIMKEILQPTTSAKGIHAPKFMVYPNPASEIIYIQNANNAEVSIIDNVGRVVMNTNLNGNNHMDISLLKNGLYFVKVTEGDFSEMHKIMVTK